MKVLTGSRPARPLIVAASALVLAAFVPSASAGELPHAQLYPTESDVVGPGYEVRTPPGAVRLSRPASNTANAGRCGAVTGEGVEVCLGVGDKTRRSLAAPDLRGATAVPQWCLDAGSTDVTHMVRTEGCTISPGTLTVRRIVGGVAKVTGLMRFTVFQHTSTSVTSPVWSHHASVIADFVSGDARGTEVTGVADCSGECAFNGQSFPLATLSAAGDVASGESSFEWPVEYDERGTATPEWTLSFRAPPITEPHSLDVPTAAEIRCDNELPGVTRSGCVFPQSIPVITWYTSALPQYGRHIAQAQASGLPGSPDSSSPLHRLTDTVFQDLNRNTTCPSSLPRPSGKSCDEYPFASTYEGGYTGGAVGGRTFEWCEIADSDTHRIGRTGPGFSACMIDEDENSGAGRELNTILYVPYRVIDNDAFYVDIE